MSSSSWRFGITLVLFGFASILPATVGAQPPAYIMQWGSGGSGDGQFSEPQGLATDAAGNVYVADRLNSRIQKFTSTGTYLTQWGSYGSGDGQFSYPWAVATDAAGNVYVADQLNNRIQKFTDTGTYLTQWSSDFYWPRGVATDSAGDVYVADAFNFRIQKFTSNGTYLTQWGSIGSGNGEFYSPQAVATDAAGNVYVAEGEGPNQRIQKFTGTGTYITQWGSGGSGNGQFADPYGLGTDAAGNVYVADTRQHRIQKFNGSGDYLTQWGTGGTGNGQFIYPVGVATDADGNIYVLDQGNNRIQKFGGIAEPPTCDVALTKSDSSDPVSVGAPFEYLLEVRNFGPSEAIDVVVRDVLPASTPFQYAYSSSGAYCYDSSGTVVCVLGYILPDSSSTITIGVFPTLPGTIENVASVVTSTPDVNPGNNFASETTTVQVSQAADVYVTQSNVPEPAVSGRTLTYTITVGNQGPSEAADVAMYQQIFGAPYSIVSVTPSRGSCTPDTASFVSCAFGNMPPGDSARVEVVIIPTYVQFSGEALYSQVSAGSSTPDPNFSNNYSFDYTVISPSAESLIGDLIQLVEGYRLKRGTENVLLHRLESVLAALAQEDTSGACSALDAFRRRVGTLAGRGLTLIQAYQLDFQADQIQAFLQCGARPRAAAESMGAEPSEALEFSFHLSSAVGEAARAELVLPVAGRVRLDVYDVSGRRVRAALDAELPSGAHAIGWDGREAGGARAPAGVYFLRLAAGPDAAIARFVLLR